jgi:hypothetical protein
LSHLEVEGDLPGNDDMGNELTVAVDLDFDKTANLPDPGPNEKLVQAASKGSVVVAGQDLTGGKRTDNATIRKVRSP